MTALVVVLTVIVAVQTVLLAGLLRGHAEVLRSLHELGVGLDPDGPAATAPGGRASSGQASGGLPTPDPRRLRADTAPIPTTAGPIMASEGRSGHDVSGVTPRDEVVGLRVTEVEHDTILVFLSSTCAGCAPFWPALADPEVPAGTRVVVVTHEEPDEDRGAIARLAPAGATVVMSDRAYDDHQVPGSPYVVHVEGRTGRIRGEGTAASWPAVRDLLLRGIAQGESAKAKALADAQRERDADHHLLAAGIAPGDPSLYTRADGTVVPGPDGGVATDEGDRADDPDPVDARAATTTP